MRGLFLDYKSAEYVHLIWLIVPEEKIWQRTLTVALPACDSLSASSTGVCVNWLHWYRRYSSFASLTSRRDGSLLPSGWLETGRDRKVSEAREGEWVSSDPRSCCTEHNREKTDPCNGTVSDSAHSPLWLRPLSPLSLSPAHGDATNDNHVTQAPITKRSC